MLGRAQRGAPMTGRMSCLVALTSAAAAIMAPTADAVTPINGGMAGGMVVAINTDPADQTSPRLSGDLMAYESFGSSFFGVRYHDLGTGLDHGISPAAGEFDSQPDVSGSRIVFTQSIAGARTPAVYDTATGNLVSLQPPIATDPFTPATAGQTVAFVDASTGGADIVIGDAAAPTAPLVDVSASPDVDELPKLAPDGDTVVWDRCDAAYNNCDIYRATRTAGAWGPPQPVALTPAIVDQLADTDGTTLAYSSVTLGTPREQYIAFRPLAGGAETRLDLPGRQFGSNIAGGVIAFLGQAPGATQMDVYAYIIATNMLVQVTDTPSSESDSDVTVLPNGDVRVAWSVDEPTAFNVHDVYARTFTPPSADPTPPSIGHTVTGTLGDNGWYTSNVDLTWSVSEPESPASLVKTGCVDRSITADQGPTTSSCSTTSAGGSAGPVDVTIKRDATPPTLTFAGNAGTYDVAQTVAITCAAADALSGIAAGCAGVSFPAYRFPLGSTTITRTASDNAGNVGAASTSFTVTVDAASLCTLTRRTVQASSAYQALTPAAQHVVDATVAAACAVLARANGHPAEKPLLIKTYKIAVAALQ